MDSIRHGNHGVINLVKSDAFLNIFGIKTLF